MCEYQSQYIGHVIVLAYFKKVGKDSDVWEVLW